MFTGIKEALIMRILTKNMHNLAVKRHKMRENLISQDYDIKSKFDPRERLPHGSSFFQ